MKKITKKQLHRQAIWRFIKFVLKSPFHQIIGIPMWMMWYNKQYLLLRKIYIKYQLVVLKGYKLPECDIRNENTFLKSLYRLRQYGSASEVIAIIKLIQLALTKWEYKLFCYGELSNYDTCGDTPDWYKPNWKSNYWRRLAFTGWRNAYVQGYRFNDISEPITEIEQVYSNVDTTQIFKNRGTGATYLGKSLEWYYNKDYSQAYFYYQHTTKRRLFYAGWNGRCCRELGTYLLKPEISYRSVTPAPKGTKVKTNIND